VLRFAGIFQPAGRGASALFGFFAMFGDGIYVEFLVVRIADDLVDFDSLYKKNADSKMDLGVSGAARLRCYKRLVRKRS